MKTEMTKIGWKEITTVKIIIGEEFPTNSTMTVLNWVESNKRLGLNRGFRTNCSCCKEKWTALTGNTHLFPSNKGNKLICDSCYAKLEARK